MDRCPGDNSTKSVDYRDFQILGARPADADHALGVATEKSESSIACRQVGPISSTVPIPKKEEVFSESRSFLFKKLRIVRMVDAKRNVLLYLTYSDKLIDGSPKNSLTAVPLNGAQLQFK